MNSFFFALMPALLALCISVALWPRVAVALFRERLPRLSRHPLFRPTVAVATLGALMLMDGHALFALPFVLGATLTEGQYPGEFIVSEANGTLSRDTVTVTVPAGEIYSPGLVLMITATKYVARTDAGTAAMGILYGICDNSDGVGAVDFTAVVVNRDAEVMGSALDANGGTEADVLDELADLNIKVRGDLANVAT